MNLNHNHNNTSVAEDDSDSPTFVQLLRILGKAAGAAFQTKTTPFAVAKDLPQPQQVDLSIATSSSVHTTTIEADPVENDAKDAKILELNNKVASMKFKAAATDWLLESAGMQTRNINSQLGLKTTVLAQFKGLASIHREAVARLSARPSKNQDPRTNGDFAADFIRLYTRYLKAQLEKKDVQIEEMKVELSHMIEKCKARTDAKEWVLDYSRLHMRQLKSQVQDKEAKIEEMKVQMSEDLQTIVDANAQLSQMQSQSNGKDWVLDCTRTHARDVMGQVQSHAAKINGLENDITNLKLEAQASEQSMAKTLSELDTSKAREQVAESRIVRLKIDLAEAKQINMTRREATTRQYNTAVDERDAANEQRDIAITQSQQSQRNCDNMKNELLHLQRTVKNLEENNQILTKVKGTMMAERDEARSQIGDSDVISQAFEELTMKLRKAESAIVGARSGEKEAQDMAASLEWEITAKEDKLEHTNSALRKLQKQVEIGDARVQELETIEVSADCELAKRQKQIDTVETRVQELEISQLAANADFNKQKTRSEETINNLRSKVRTLSFMVETAKNTHKQELDAATIRLASSEVAHKQDLRAKNGELEAIHIAQKQVLEAVPVNFYATKATHVQERYVGTSKLEEDQDALEETDESKARQVLELNNDVHQVCLESAQKDDGVAHDLRKLSSSSTLLEEGVIRNPFRGPQSFSVTTTPERKLSTSTDSSGAIWTPPNEKKLITFDSQWTHRAPDLPLLITSSPSSTPSFPIPEDVKFGDGLPTQTALNWNAAPEEVVDETIALNIPKAEKPAPGLPPLIGSSPSSSPSFPVPADVEFGDAPSTQTASNWNAASEKVVDETIALDIPKAKKPAPDMAKIIAKSKTQKENGLVGGLEMPKGSAGKTKKRAAFKEILKNEKADKIARMAKVGKAVKK